MLLVSNLGLHYRYECSSVNSSTVLRKQNKLCYSDVDAMARLNGPHSDKFYAPNTKPKL